MGLQKGDKAEVVVNRDNSSVSWRVAMILSSNGMENCTSRDIVEVFYDRSWRMAAVLRVLESQKETKNRYLVRLLEFPQEIVVDESNIRMKQLWHDEKRDPIEKDEASRSLKRTTPYGSSIIEAHNIHAKTVRAIEKDGRKQKRKVDAVSYPSEIQGEKNMHASDSSDSDACSVGSCSVTVRNQNNFCIIPFSCQESDSVCGDAESCYGLGSERKSSDFPLKEEVEGSIRKLELHAYRRTLEALYARGTLSWEQESMLTNLRIMLHVSNDEHLMELKSLVSTKTAMHFR